jgi:hypothetical protein
MADRNRRLILTERPTGTVDENTVLLQAADPPEAGRVISRPGGLRRLGGRDGLHAVTQARSTHTLT